MRYVLGASYRSDQGVLPQRKRQGGRLACLNKRLLVERESPTCAHIYSCGCLAQAAIAVLVSMITAEDTHAASKDDGKKGMHHTLQIVG